MAEKNESLPVDACDQAPHNPDPLALENQLCFPLYAASKELTRRYKPFLDPLGLTYTQYVTMMVLWEKDGITVSELGRRLYLNSATLTPLLKRLEAHGYITRIRSNQDERAVIVQLTPAGRELHERAHDVPRCMLGCMKGGITPEEGAELKRLLLKLLATLSSDGAQA
ncbi:MAG: MarR family winged helix-turn-helix transcriptional regulator [Parafannyhessea sp.]|uniref:MarR family winged helix-turn-helix transcriptional regulator n=1 Tax=Parafannyhessea sp. TaxID=2847324 RepID=UPI003F110699